MRSVRLAGWDGAPVLLEQNTPGPKPSPGELLIRVHAAGITPSELFWYPTSHDKAGATRQGAIPGHEFSGVVAAVGEGADGMAAGGEVFGMNDWFSDGALAEYCIARLDSVAPKPQRVSHLEAAATPIGALTAWQGLFDRAQLQLNERLLVHGGAGAVGSFAVQLARLHGARVTATASSRNVEFVKSLGAGQVIDYQTSRFEACVKEVDVVFDTVGGETLQRSWNVLKANGRVVTIASGAEHATDERVKQAFFIVAPNHKQLIEVGGLLERGQLRAIVDAVVPLARAAEAYAGKVARQGRGKVVADLINMD